MDWEDKIEDIENRFIALCDKDGVDEAIIWLAGSFMTEAFNNAGFILTGGNSDYFEHMISEKAKEVHGD